jgi:hypothetical protein
MAPSAIMRDISARTTTAEARHQTRRGLRHWRDWPGTADTPYSPLFSIGLLLIIALAFNIGG